jgi:hypothetical protein
MQPISDRGGMDPGGIPAGVHMDRLLLYLAGSGCPTQRTISLALCTAASCLLITRLTALLLLSYRPALPTLVT